MERRLTTIWDELFAFGESAPSSRLTALIRQAYDDYKQKTFEINVLAPEYKVLRSENEKLQIVQARYEYVRRLSPRAFEALSQDSARTLCPFDDLVDRWMKVDISKEMNAIAKALNEENP